MALRAVKMADTSSGGEPPTDSVLAAMLIDWPTFWQRDHSDEEWLVWPIVPVGRGIAFYAPAKTGKSLVVLALVAAAATGRPGLDGTIREAVDVLYLDFEMTQDDLQERLEDMGYGPNDDLSHLHYASLPSLPPLNEPEGAKALMELVHYTNARLVVIDTLRRSVEGEEKDERPFTEFARWTGLALKAEGVAFLRVDHAGKDLGKGQRGSSAKNDDVDVVWLLTRIEGGVMLRCTHRRMGWVPDQIRVMVDDENGWRFDLARDETYPDGTKELAALLDALELPLDVSRRAAEKAIRDSQGQGRKSSAVSAALRWRKAETPLFGGGNHPGNHLRTNGQNPQTGTKIDTPSDQGEPSPEPLGTSDGGSMGVGVPVLTGTTPPNPGPEPLPGDLEAPF